MLGETQVILGMGMTKKELRDKSNYITVIVDNLDRITTKSNSSNLSHEYPCLWHLSCYIVVTVSASPYSVSSTISDKIYILAGEWA